MKEGEPTPEPEKQPLFALGTIVATPAALEILARLEMNPLALISRHVTGDWGDLVEEDIEANQEAVDRGLRVFSSYEVEDGQKIWVITEHDRSYTTILKPNEY